MTAESKSTKSSTKKQEELQKGLLIKPVKYLIHPPKNWKTHPWDVNLLEIVQKLHDRIIIEEQVNLSQAGRAISVASNLHRKRAEYILHEEKKRKLQEEKKASKPKSQSIEDITIPPSHRIRSRRVDTVDLLNALAKAVHIVKRRKNRTDSGLKNSIEELDEDILTILPEELVRELDIGSEGVEHYIDQVYEVIFQNTLKKNQKSIGFYSLVQKFLDEEQNNASIIYKGTRDRFIRLYIVRIILCILYLILRNKITVDQIEFFDDLQIQPIMEDN